MAITVNEASAVLREAVRDTIRKRSLLVLIQGSVMVLAGVLALIFPAFMSTGLLVLLGWLLILSGIVQVDLALRRHPGALLLAAAHHHRARGAGRLPARHQPRGRPRRPSPS